VIKAGTLAAKAWQCLCALLIVVAATHAVLPTELPLQRSSGSAFSATTMEVATGCASRIETQRLALPDQPGPPPDSCSAPLPAIAGFDRASAPVGIPQARAPPLADPALAPLNPRAPPAA